MDTEAPMAAPTRRAFMGRLIRGLGAVSALLVGLPVVGSLLAPAFQRRVQERWIELGSIETLPLGEPCQLAATAQEKDGWYAHTVQRAVWVIRKDSQHYTVFDPRCTHLGCAYRWDRDKREFACPCHGGRYDISGHVTSGPPPRGLDTLVAKIESGKLFVRFTS